MLPKPGLNFVDGFPNQVFLRKIVFEKEWAPHRED